MQSQALGTHAPTQCMVDKGLEKCLIDLDRVDSPRRIRSSSTGPAHWAELVDGALTKVKPCKRTWFVVCDADGDQ